MRCRKRCRKKLVGWGHRERERERQATTRLVGWAKFFAKLAAQRRRLVGWVGKGKKGRRAAAGLAWRNECKRLLVGWGHRGWLAKGKKKLRKNASDYTTTSRLGGDRAED